MFSSINPILQQSDYPELKVRIGIDVGDNIVVQYGWDTFRHDEKTALKKPHLDILGLYYQYCFKNYINSKARSDCNRSVSVQCFGNKTKNTFSELSLTLELWNYVSNSTGGSTIYQSVHGIDQDL
jgi:adenylate cyclase